MKATGIIRQVDELGRIVLPIELRRTFGIRRKDAIEIYIDDNNDIILRKYEPACIFCGSSENMLAYKGKNVCKKCAVKMKEIFED